ncbi:HET-domain-containing protein [Apiospora marii]|uniref:HET-domain-containing protein n=1 Tax=Apiospora marii TaxID=335849 RepID=A0ABR1RL50_9PEZI
MGQTEITGASQDEGRSVFIGHGNEEPHDSGKVVDNDRLEESGGLDESDDSDEDSSPSYWFSPEQVEKQVRLLDIDPRGSLLCNQCRATNWSATLDYTSKAGQGASYPIDVGERVGLDRDCALCSLFARTFLSKVDESTAQSAPWTLSAFNKRCMLVDSRIRYLFQPDVEVAILHSGATRYVQHINEERVEREGFLAFARTRDLRTVLEKNESTEAYPLSRFVGAQYDPGMVRGWLEACDIDLDDTFSIPGMRVIDCRFNTIVNCTAEMQYLALSYVWSLAGRDMVAVENRQPGEGSALVLPPMVPRVVSNAMQVVTDLGYRYLWVDQFCIDQSAGQEHIGDHISKMDLVYSNALATIIAASSKGALPGVGDTPRAGQMMLNIKGRVDEKMGITEDDITVFSTPPAFKYALPATVWHSRGWCFQESVLAPRRLYFMDYELVFQSEEIHSSDSYPDPIVNQELIYDTSFPKTHHWHGRIGMSSLMQRRIRECMDRMMQ